MRTSSLFVLAVLVLGAGCRPKQTPAPKPSAAQAPPPAPSASSVPAPSPAALAARYVACAAAFNRSDFAELASCYGLAAISRWPDSGLPDEKGRGAVIDNRKKAFKTAFPDGKVAPQIVLVNGTELAATGVLSGTHAGPLMGADETVPATGKAVGLLVFQSTRYDPDGLVHEEALLADRGSLLYQLGKSKHVARARNSSGLVNAPVVVSAAHDATESANLELVAKAWRALAEKNLAAVAATLADDVVLADQTAPADLRGKNAVVPALDAFLRAFSGIKLECPTRLAAGRYVASVCRLEATQSGEWRGIKPTGLPVAFTIAELAELDAGLLKQLVRFFDSAALASKIEGSAADAGKAQQVP